MSWVILNFDLGLKGDYESLYKTLDNLNAQDAGNSNCVFEYKFASGIESHQERFDEIIKLLEDKVEIKKGDRLYAIVFNSDKIPRGKFLFGHRQRPIWEGYGDKEEDDQLPF